MSKKVGRNEKCPCGSGLKYKKCCWKKGINYNKREKKPILNSTESFIKKYNSLDLALTFGALSINEKNHGKDLRLEYLTLLSLYYGNFSNSFVSIDELQRRVNKDYPYHHFEDPPENIFTENVMSSIGNTVVYSGNYDQGVYTLQNQIRALNYYKDDYDIEFQKVCNDTVGMTLLLSDSIANSNNHESNILGNINRHELIDFGKGLTQRKQSLFFEWGFLKKIGSLYKLNFQAVSNLVLEIENVKKIKPILGDDKESLLFKKPFIVNESGLWVISPTTIIVALQLYIWDTAKKYQCLEILCKNYHATVLRDLKFQLEIRLKWQKWKSKFTSDTNKKFIQLYKYDKDKIAIVHVDKSAYSDKIISEQGRMQIEEEASNNADFRGQLIEKIRLEYPRYKLIFLDLFSSLGLPHLRLIQEIPNVRHIPANVYKLVMAIRVDDFDSLIFFYYCISRDRFEQDVKISPIYGFQELFSIFYDNYSFYIKDEVKPNFVVYEFGGFTKLIHKALKREDVRIVFKHISGFKNPVMVNVMKESEHKIRYAEFENRLNYLEFCLLELNRTLWVKSAELLEKVLVEKRSVIWEYNEAICFWLVELKDLVNKLLNKGIHPIDLRYELIGDHNSRIDDIQNLNHEFEIPIKLEKDGILIQIPKDINSLLIEDNNKGEIKLMKAIMIGLYKYSKRNMDGGNLSEASLLEELQIRMPLNRKKMILLIDSREEVAYDSRGINTKRSFPEEAQQLLMDEIVPGLGVNVSKIKAMKGKNEKKQLCIDIVSRVLLPLLRKELSNYNSISVLDEVLKLSEANIHSQALFRYRLPYRVECYGNYEEIINDISDEANKTGKVSIALRCLIEHLSTEITNGEDVIPNSLIDRITSIMSLIVFWGATGDMVEYDLFDIRLSILPSCRIGTNSHEIVEDFFHEFNQKRSKELLQDISRTTERFYKMQIDDAQRNKLNNSFKEEYGFSLEQYQEIIIVLIEYSFKIEECVVNILLDDLYDILKEHFTIEINAQEVQNFIEFSCLQDRGPIDKVPKGYNASDIMPWRYNRRLSCLYKPIIIFENSSKQLYIKYSPRLLSASFKYINRKISTGRFKSNEGGAMESFMGTLSNMKGTILEKTVYKILEKFSNDFLDKEVKINPKSKLKSDKDLGDIDILFINSKLKIIVSIECKNTEAAKNSKEMIEEIGYYLKEEKGYIAKHKKREKWLVENIDKLEEYTKMDLRKFRLRSAFITKEALPMKFIKKRDLDMAFLDMYDLENINLEKFISICLKG